jgi:hypothetical protein
MCYSHDWQAVVASADKEDINKAIFLLEKTGMFTDEDGFASKLMIKEASRYLIDRIIKDGFRGGELVDIGGYYPSAGELAAIYDSERFKSYRAAKKYLDGYVKRKHG